MCAAKLTKTLNVGIWNKFWCRTEFHKSKDGQFAAKQNNQQVVTVRSKTSESILHAWTTENFLVHKFVPKL